MPTHTQTTETFRSTYFSIYRLWSGQHWGGSSGGSNSHIGSKSQQWCVPSASDSPRATCKVSLWRSCFFWTHLKTAFVSNSFQFVKTPVPEGWTHASKFGFAGRHFKKLPQSHWTAEAEAVRVFLRVPVGFSEPLGFLFWLSSLQAACTLPCPLYAGLWLQIKDMQSKSHSLSQCFVWIHMLIMCGVYCACACSTYVCVSGTVLTSDASCGLLGVASSW